MNKFKVGDRVVCHKFQAIPNGIQWAPEMDAIEGKTGTINRPTNSILNGWIVQVDGENRTWSFPASALTLAHQPHKHAELIKAWADGAEIQERAPEGCNEWRTTRCPFWWSEFFEFRIKPKPDVVKTASVWQTEKGGIATSGYSEYPNAKFTFDGETGKLKAVEILA